MKVCTSGARRGRGAGAFLSSSRPLCAALCCAPLCSTPSSLSACCCPDVI